MEGNPHNKPPGIQYLDPKISEDATLSSMMIVVDIGEGDLRFDCIVCYKRYKHHTSLFRHFRDAHPMEYEEKVALREQIKAEQTRAKQLGLPYPRRRIRNASYKKLTKMGRLLKIKIRDQVSQEISIVIPLLPLVKLLMSPLNQISLIYSFVKPVMNHLDADTIAKELYGLEDHPDLISCPYNCNRGFKNYDNVLAHLNVFHRQLWFSVFDTCKDLKLDFLKIEEVPSFYCGVCFVANNSVGQTKEYNIKIHFETNNGEKYGIEEKRQLSEKLTKNLLGQQKVLIRLAECDIAKTTVSFEIAKILSKHQKQFAEVKCSQMLKSFSDVSLSRRTKVRRVEDMGSYITYQLKVKLSHIE
ncbi:unnamed protein product [Lepeophtheirus salmonis]|uniref:(salmon louse) hypothetical protein n=1 Tax=Lepeophtheirus salmonis TaxID=72036 RepID=A0A7R8H0Y2_LEPSM|nr:unnamed protein product [Lepeophtheirus salmonis]CAF2797855.1 unnamed protein product [Lepeophtheirus salmonis]